MKIKSLFAILLVLTILTCTCVLPTSAKETTVNDINVEVIINDEVSAETKAKIERYFANGEPANDDKASTYGITCTLLGHKITSTSVDVITHKVRTTAPRCLCKTYNYMACSRCDYETSELIATENIYCCA